MRQRLNNIDFIRGVAVLLVLVYHLNFQLNNKTLFQSGFLGVDIFFVLSGYLIINIIYKNHNHYNFRDFFFYFISKRLIRLWPAMIIVVLLTLLVLITIGSPSDIVLNAKNSLPSLFFLKNIYQLFSGEDYFYKYQYDLFLHFWSLGVEFQFYILYSTTLFFIFKLKERYIHFFFIINILLSFFLFVALNEKNKIINFYIPFTRIWEFLLGWYFFYFNKKNNIKNFSFKYLIFCLLFILTIIYIYEEKYKVIYSVLIIVATTLSLNVKESKFRNSNFICLTGKMSYSIYLVHFPIIGFFHLYGYHHISLLLLIIIIFIISFISYEVIEKKLKQFLLINSKYLIYLLAPLLILFVSNKVIVSANGFYDQLSINLKDTVRFNIKDLKINNNYCLNQEYRNYCKNFINGASREIIIVGDSHMNDLASVALSEDNFFKHNNVTIMTADTCYFLPTFNKIKTKVNHHKNQCNEKFQNDRIRYIKSKKEPIVIMGGRLPMYVDGGEINTKKDNTEINDDNFKDFYLNWNFQYLTNEFKSPSQKDFITSLKKIKKAVDDVKGTLIIIFPIPEIYVEPFYFIKKNKTLIYSYEYEIFKKRSETSFSILNEINGKNIIKIFPHKFLCTKKKCYLNPNLQNFYRDTNHLNKKGYLRILNKIKAELNVR